MSTSKPPGPTGVPGRSHPARPAFEDEARSGPKRGSGGAAPRVGTGRGRRGRGNAVPADGGAPPPHRVQATRCSARCARTAWFASQPSGNFTAVPNWTGSVDG
ncbi:hypothetical protein CP966_13445 [Streptomyces galilaeus]|nr:hypothetical protein CP966_13445 [Streptomyces galilaeus]